MSLIHVTQVDLTNDDGQAVVERPAPGDEIDLHGILIQGYLRAPSLGPGCVRLFVDGQRMQDWPVHNSPEGTRFHAAVSALDLGVRFDIRLAWVGETGRPLTFARLRGQRAQHLRRRGNEAQPILLVGMGRSGSTLGMRLLGEHPEVVYRAQYPFETRMAQYYAYLAAMQARPADLTDPQLEQLDAPWRLRPNPYFRPDPETFGWSAGPGAEMAMAHAVRATESFYRHVASQQTGVRFGHVLEKCPPVSSRVRLMHTLYPGARTVLLVRDLRDVLASVLAFNAKRGFAAFGREHVDSDADFARILGKQGANLLSFRERYPDTVVLRYEDLVASPRDTLARAFSDLRMAASEAVLDEVIARTQTDASELVWHRTSNTVSASVGRWRADLSAALQEVCRDSMADYLQAFGYTDA